jgi:hypothetical protein
MGIQGFYNQIKKFYNLETNKTIVNTLPPGFQYDFIFFDFQSGIYQVKNELLEYDYLVRLIFYIKFRLSKGENILYNVLAETKYKRIIDRIYLKFKDFIGLQYGTLNLPNDNTIIITTCDELINKFQEKNGDNFRDYIVDKTFANTIKIMTDHNLTPDKCFIFFDGVPSIAKLKEQLSRRIEPIISSNIKKKLYDDFTDINPDKFNEKEFFSYLSTSYGISIGIGTPIIDELIIKFRTSGMFINSQEKYGEAEHQIMRFLDNNGYVEGENKFRGKKILLSSPDSDLILLSFIMYCKGYPIDIYRYEFIADGNYQFDMTDENPYKLQIEYILTEKLITNIFNCRTYEINCEKLKDLVYIFLILGDDFLPTIPNISANNIPDIIRIYNEYINTSGNRNIIYFLHSKGIYVLNFEGFTNLLERISTIIIRNTSKTGKTYSNTLDTSKFGFLNYIIPDNFSKIQQHYDKNKEYYFIDGNTEQIFKKIKFYEKGAIVNSSGIPTNLIRIDKTEFDKISTEDMLKKYCEGCNFILDLYYNNNLQNYYWYYSFDRSPRANEISNYIKTKVINGDPFGKMTRYFSIFNYFKLPLPSPHTLTKSSDDYEYFSREQYIAYSSRMIQQILTSIKDKINEDRRKKGLLEYSDNSSSFIYENIDIIYSCINKTYFNKCIDYHIDLSEAERPENITSLNKNNFTGGYYQKYLKYKNKYLNLKNNKN